MDSVFVAQQDLIEVEVVGDEVAHAGLEDEARGYCHKAKQSDIQYSQNDVDGTRSIARVEILHKGNNWKN